MFLSVFWNGEEGDSFYEIEKNRISFLRERDKIIESYRRFSEYY